MQIDEGQGARFPEMASAGRIAGPVGGDVVSGGPCWIILDVEGTLVPTDYVHSILFDYARTGLRDWIVRNADTPVGRDALAEVRRMAGLAASAGPDELLPVLLAWIDQDRKEPALKAVQGHLWQEAYARGELRTPLFPDVPPALRRWRAAGHRLAVFSSGSIAAQRAVFSRTDVGDLRDLFTAHFDPHTVGSKREAGAYRAIRDTLTPVGNTGDPPVFLSDVPLELDAAAVVGWRTLGVARAGEPYGAADFGAHQVVPSFDRTVQASR